MLGDGVIMKLDKVDIRIKFYMKYPYVHQLYYSFVKKK